MTTTLAKGPTIGRVIADLRHERSARELLPPGELTFSLQRSHRFQRDTLQTLLAWREHYGPVFSFRLLHRPIVGMIGPEANHFVTVTGAENFSWRKGMFGEQLTPLIGDGLITTDGTYHDRARRAVTAMFHHRRMDAAVAVMVEEAERALEPWRPGAVVDVYRWSRELTINIAMRALLGLDPRAREVGHRVAVLFGRGLAFYEAETWMMLARGPGTPWSRMQAARRDLDSIVSGELQRRQCVQRNGEDVLSMLLDARDENGQGFTAAELRGQVMNLLYAGHDTTSSTVSFLLYELGRNPVVLARVLDEQERVIGSGAPSTETLVSGLPYLSMVLDETLRLYPPVWFGPRLSVKPFTLQGHRIPAGVHVFYSSWATHRLPELFADPEAFIPERFASETRRKLAAGAYIPFGGGRRICIGERFGQLAVKAVLTMLLQRFRCELRPGYELRIIKTPTLSPRGGLPVVIRARRPAPNHEIAAAESRQKPPRS